jgi:putative Mg2+ transporter-C (MgtC) family protein
MALAVLCMASMSLLHRLEARLPGRMTLNLSLAFQPGNTPSIDILVDSAEARGYRVLHDSLTITFADNQAVWRVNLVAPDKASAVSPADLAAEMAATQGVAKFSIVPVRS